MNLQGVLYFDPPKSLFATSLPVQSSSEAFALSSLSPCVPWRVGAVGGLGGAERDADSLPYPAGGEELLGESAVEGVQPGLAVAVVGERARLVVQQHAHALVLLGVAGHCLAPPAVPRVQLALVQLQAPGELVHAHHAPLAFLLAGDSLVGDLRRGAGAHEGGRGLGEEERHR